MTKSKTKTAVPIISEIEDDETEEDEDEEDYEDDYSEGSNEYGSNGYGSSEETIPHAQNGKTAMEALNADQLLLCSATLKGYSLRNKKWLTFSIGSVKDIKYNEGAFDSLVLPEDHKELILALTESQVANKESFDDVIQGKGRGMIMLLSGPPGVGKTLTAESGKCQSFLPEREGFDQCPSRGNHESTPLHDECR